MPCGSSAGDGEQNARVARRASKERCGRGEFIVWLIWEGMWSEAMRCLLRGHCNECIADKDFTPIRE